MSRLTIIQNKVAELRAQNFKNGFSDDVLRQVTKALNEEIYGDFWKYNCVPSMFTDQLIEEYFEGDVESFDDFNRLCEESKIGGFVMPDWGTRGT